LPFKKNCLKIVKNNNKKAFVFVRDKNIHLLKEMNKAVKMFEAESSRKINLLKTVSLISGVLVLIVIVLAWFLVVYPLVCILKNTTAHLSEGAQQVAEASAQVAQSSQVLAEGANTQAASFQEVLLSLEDVKAKS